MEKRVIWDILRILFYRNDIIKKLNIWELPIDLRSCDISNLSSIYLTNSFKKILRLYKIGPEATQLDLYQDESDIQLFFNK